MDEEEDDDDDDDDEVHSGFVIDKKCFNAALFEKDEAERVSSIAAIPGWLVVVVVGPCWTNQDMTSG